MSSKKWTLMFIITVILCLGMVYTFNLITDPFGAFSSEKNTWYSYAFTLNPRVGKVGFLEQEGHKFDAFIVGSSATSSIPVQALNDADGLNYYNAFVYGADMYDVSKIAQYIINHQEAKKLILNIGPVSAYGYHPDNDPLTYGLHYKTGDVSEFTFNMRYGFVNPRYGYEKLKTMAVDSFVQDGHDVFREDTGAYDKSKRDVEKIGNLDHYLINYPVFNAYPDLEKPLDDLDQFLSEMELIKALCLEKDVELEVVIFPMYGDYIDYFPTEDIDKFYKSLVEITDFWDFSLSSLSKDPRFFYDEAHFRNTMGEMMVQRMRKSITDYIPEDFGNYVTQDNVEAIIAEYSTDYKFNGTVEDESYSTEVTIINYHHFADELISDSTMTIERFESHVIALLNAGYETVHISDLINYVEKGIALPEKPLVITMDDGYLSNYNLAYEVLKKHNVKSTFFVIGSSVGKDTYKTSDNPIIPHYTYEQAKEMMDSGLIEIQSHTYDLHQYGPFEASIEGARESMVMLDSDTEESYITALNADIDTMNDMFQTHLGIDVYALAYPRGGFDIKTEIITEQAGIGVTLTTVEGRNTIIKGLPQSLRQLNRYTPWNQMSDLELIDYISK